MGESRRSLFWPFLFYLVFFASASALFPFMALYYQSVGLTGGEIGLLTGLAPLITMVSAPFWTGISDATYRHKLVLSISILGAIFCALVIPSVHIFALLLIAISLYTFVASPIISLGDSATMSMLENQQGMYGRVRLGGTIGWGMMAVFAGTIMDRYGIVWAFWIYSAGMVVTLLIAQSLRFGRAKVQHDYWKGMGTLLADRRWVFFLCMVFVCSVGMASITIYQFIYMAEIGADKTLMGLSLTISTLSELPVMIFAGRLLKRFKPYGLIVLGMFVIGIRLLLYSAFNFPVAIIFFQLLHGLTFPAIWIAGVAYAYENAPSGLAATSQGVFAAVMSGLGTAVGGVVGGLLVQGLGGRWMYLVFGVVVMSAAMLFILIQKRMVTVPPMAG